MAATLIVGGFFVFAGNVLADGLITVTASSPVNVSTDAISGASVAVGNIIMAESDSGNFGIGTVILNAPSGFIFDDTSVVQITVYGDSSAGNNINNIGNGTTLSATTTPSSITFIISAKSASGHPNILTWSSIKVKPTSGTPLVNGYITISGTASGTTYSTTSPVLLTEVAGSPSAAHSTFSCSPTSGIMAGVSTSCTAIVRDLFNNPISNASVNLIASGTDTTFNHNPVLTDINGQATFEVRSNTAQTETITATINSSVSLTPVSITFIAASAAIGTIHAVATTIEASLSPGTPVALTITVIDTYGNSVNNYNVDLRTDFAPHIPGLGSASISGSGSTQGSGQTTRTLTGINVGIATLTFNGLTVAGDTTIHFVDKTKPVITVIPPDPATVEFRTQYTDAGATAQDNIDGSVTVLVSSDVNTSTINQTPSFTNKIVGIYHVTYIATDSSGNTQTASREVDVRDTVAPVISLITSNANPPGILGIRGSITFILTSADTEPDGTVVNDSVYNGHTLHWSTSDNHVWTTTYTVAEYDTDQTSLLQISGVTMTDEAGNTSSPASGSDVAKTIDAHWPTLMSVHIQSNNAHTNLAKIGDTVALTFTANENIQTPTVKIAGHDAVVTGSGTSWSATYIMAGSDIEGTIPFSIDFSDLANNAASAAVIITTDLSNVTFDKTAPTVSSVNFPTYINIANQTSVPVSGTGTDNYQIATVNYDLNDSVNHVTGSHPVIADAFSFNINAHTLVDGPVTLAITLTDEAGNTTTVPTTVSSTKDTVAPTIDSHSDVGPVEATSASGATVTYTPPDSHDAHDGTLPADCSPVSGTTFALGLTTVTCNKTDSARNVAAPTSFKVSVVDTTPPVVTPPVLQTFEATGPLTSPTLVPATAVDLVDPSPIITYDPHLFPVGDDQTVTWTATDALGNHAQATSLVTIKDSTPPTIDSHADIVAEANGPAGAVITYTPPMSHDLVDGDLISACTPSSGSTFPLGETTVTCNKTDKHENAATPITFKITVQDTTPPVIAHHDDVTAEATSPTTTVVTYTNPTATDLVDVTDLVTCAPVSGSEFSFGNTTVTCTSTDNHSNTAISTFVVHVVDTTPPTINNTPADMIVAANQTGSASGVTYALPTATDIVDVTDSVICAPPSGSTFLLGVTTVTCNSQDATGNQATPTSFTITVNPDIIAKLIVSAFPSTLTTADTSTITVNGRDQYDNFTTNQSGTVVVVSADNGGALGQTILTLTNGVVTTSLNKTVAGIVHITAASGSLIPGNTTATFTPADTTPPTVSSFYPALHATNVPVTSPLYIMFSEPLKSTTITSANIHLMKDNSALETPTSDSLVPAIVSLVEGDERVNITPSNPLDFSSSYYFVVTGGVQDVMGNALVATLDKTNTGFTTAVNTADLTPPTVITISQYPAASATDVALAAQPSVDFSEAMDATTLTSANVKLVRDSDASEVSTTVVVGNGATRAIIQPAGPLEQNTAYHVVVTMGVKDVAENPLAADYTGGSFTTIQIQPIVIDEVVAQNNYVTADDTYINGWHYIFRITVNTNETQLQAKFADWVNSADPTKKVVVNGNTRLLFNSAGGGIGAGVGLTNSNIENGYGTVSSYSLGNEYLDQVPLFVDTTGIDNNLSTPGRQIQFDVFTKIPTDTAPGFYTTSYGVNITSGI